MRAAFIAAQLAAVTAFAAEPAVPPFSIMAAGELKMPWREMTLPGIKAARFTLVAEDWITVLRTHAEAAAGTAALAVEVDPHVTPMLSWRWKVDRVLERADMERKAGDDFAARVYVFFDLPLEELTFTQRMRIEVARLIYGREVPSAAICYVWDNRHPVGTIQPNPYSERVRMIVVESGASRAGQWTDARRNIEEDYRRAFETPAGKPVPRVSGIAVGADTDQTGESVSAWFGDLRLGAP